ncbi:TPA: hypothetical protein R0E75_006223 [Klebsiella michiganensis]|nr:hypothetical protein [Klebsiella michiganensis]
MHHPDTVPEAALRACPGYRIADVGEPVAPVSAAPPGKQAAEYFRPGLFPARGVNALAGLPDRRRRETRSPVSS